LKDAQAKQQRVVANQTGRYQYSIPLNTVQPNFHQYRHCNAIKILITNRASGIPTQRLFRSILIPLAFLYVQQFLSFLSNLFLVMLCPARNFSPEGEKKKIKEMEGISTQDLIKSLSSLPLPFGLLWSIVKERDSLSLFSFFF
jgi:hypothetical protein